MSKGFKELLRRLAAPALRIAVALLGFAILLSYWDERTTLFSLLFGYLLLALLLWLLVGGVLEARKHISSFREGKR